MDFLTLENFLYLQAGLVFVGVIYLLRKGSRQGMRLRWKGGRNAPSAPNEMMAQPRMWDSAAVGGRNRPTRQVNVPPLNPQGPAERDLNVHFNFNGHSWDAYEVLGLPAGASHEKVDAALQDALSRSEIESREFYKMACDAIKKHK